MFDGHEAYYIPTGEIRVALVTWVTKVMHGAGLDLSIHA